jgi:hypothetical protein
MTPRNCLAKWTAATVSGRIRGGVPLATCSESSIEDAIWSERSGKMSRKHLVLSVFVQQYGTHGNAWRRPNIEVGGHPRFERWASLVKLLERGIFRTEYTGKTLRDHLALPPPARARDRAERRGFSSSNAQTPAS